jgi:hypothetical protein
VYAYTIHANARLVVVRFAPGTAAASILDFFGALEADPAYERSLNGLVDARGIEVDMALEDVRGLARHVVEKGLKTGRWAMLVDQPKATALAMLYTKAVDSAYSFQVFSTASGISAYLGIEAADYLGSTTPRSRPA